MAIYITLTVSKSLEPFFIITYSWEFVGPILILKFFQTPFLCINSSPVDMFVWNSVEIDRVVSSHALHTDRHFEKTHF